MTSFKMADDISRYRVGVLTHKDLERHRALFNIKMISYQYRKSHCGDKTVVSSSYLHNGISYTGKMASLYWIRAQVRTQRC